MSNRRNSNVNPPSIMSHFNYAYRTWIICCFFRKRVLDIVSRQLRGLKNCLKQSIWVIFGLYLGPFGHGRASGDMVGRCLPNSDCGGCSGARVMAIFGSYVEPHFPNIGYFEAHGGIWSIWGLSWVYEGIWKYMEVYKGGPNPLARNRAWPERQGNMKP